MMRRFYLIKLLLLPSVLSIGVCTGLAAVTVAATAWAYIRDNQLFYDYLFGVHGFSTLLVQESDGLLVLRNAVFSSNLTYYILILLCSLIVGLLVYVLLEGLRLATQETAMTWRQMHLSSSAYTQTARQNLARQLLRIAALAGWALYTIIFVTTLLPTSMVLARAGTDSIGMSMAWGWVNVLQSFALLAVGLHMHVIFARLTALRPRLFGGADIEIAEQEQLR
jgi:hypothetical protein